MLNGLLETAEKASAAIDSQEQASRLSEAFEAQLEKSFPTQMVHNDLEQPYRDRSIVSSIGPYLYESAARIAEKPFNLHMSCIYQSFMKSLPLSPVDACEPEFILPDDDDITYAFDHHSLVTSELPAFFDEPLKTADEFIEEINFIMERTNVDSSPLYGDESISRDLPSATSKMETMTDEDLKAMDVNVLNAVLDELEGCVGEYSAMLVQELAYREELDFEQEQKDIFISRLDELHRRLQSHRRRASLPLSTMNHDLLSSSPEFAFFPESKESDMLDEIPSSVEGKRQQQVSMGSRARIAAHAAVSMASNATALLKRKLGNLSNREPDDLVPGQHVESHQSPSPVGDRVQSHSATSKAAAIARLRQWTRRQAGVALRSKATSTFRALLRRDGGGQKSDNKSAVLAHGGRESYSVIATPSSSPVNIPAVPAMLTHSASGQLTGHSQSNPEDIEYKNLTTTIPYHKSRHLTGPTVEQLQALNDLLLAILTNNPNLSNMLTDYILKIYAPAETLPFKLPL